MRLLLPLFALLFTFSCASTADDKTKSDSVVPVKAIVPEFKKGDLTTLSVSADPSNSFTVYLPSNFDSTKKHPLVVFFDPHADGSLPLNKYKSLAEKWGYIFAGSNVSKNGMTGEQTMKIGNALIEEVKRNISIDETEIILCGFSGGARVASTIAFSRNDVKGVICNSAAPSQPMNGKIFIGLAGLGDMNYLEMKNFMNNQDANTSPHELLAFDGKHEWAPVGMMEEALLIASIIPINGNNNQNTWEMYRALGGLIYDQSDSIKKISCMIANNLLLSGKRAQEAAFSTGKVRVTDESTIELPKKTDPCIKSDEAAWKAAQAEESVLQQELASALMSQDTTWWKFNSPNYFESKKQGADKFMRQRLRGYASLMCYSYANQAFKANNLHAAEKLVAVYAIVDPTNSEWAYMGANLYMQLGLKEYALNSLETAVKLGFNDKSRLQNDPAFSAVRNDMRFGALFGNMN